MATCSDIFILSSARPVSGLILFHQLKVEGFLVWRWGEEWPAAFKELAQWIQEVMSYPSIENETKYELFC